MMGWLERRLRRGNIPDSLPYTNPLHAGRHPFQTYMLVLCLVSSLPLLFGQNTSGAVEETLPQWLSFGWGAALLMGPTVALLGSFWRGCYDMALLLERVGLDIAGCAALIYALVVVVVAGWSGLVASCIVLGFGVSCLTRARDIARIFSRAKPGASRRVRGEDE